jgi:hypothetical protein
MHLGVGGFPVVPFPGSDYVSKFRQQREGNLSPFVATCQQLMEIPSNPWN